MKVTMLSGSYNNCGDHLIQFASLNVLGRFLPGAIIKVIDRRSIREEYSLLENSDLVIIAGGPALRPRCIPDIVDIPEEFWWKTTSMGIGAHFSSDSEIGDTTSRFFVQALPSSFRDSRSARIATKIHLERNNESVDRVFLTGCPVSFAEFELPQSASQILVLSDHQPYEKGLDASFRTILASSLDFPGQIVCAFHHGKRYRKSQFFSNLSRSFPMVQFEFLGGDLDAMLSLYGQASAHIGFRLHAHLLMNNLCKPTFLFAEDERGRYLNTHLNSVSVNLPRRDNTTSRTSLMKKMRYRKLMKSYLLVVGEHTRDFVEYPLRPEYDIKPSLESRWQNYFDAVLGSLKNRTS
jgi:hypothetical protein